LQVKHYRNQPLRGLLKPHILPLSLGLAAVLLEGAANLAEPWPLKVVLDNALKAKSPQGWLNHLVVALAGPDRYAIVKLAAISIIVIAALGAICAYTEKFLAMKVGQSVMHDLRLRIYANIQRLSLAYHDETRTGDLIGCLTSDIDAIQSFVATGLLGALVSGFTLVGMAGVMLWLNWKFTLAALSVAPILFVVVYRYTRRIKKASREARTKEGEIISLIQEVLSSTRLVKAYAREDYEQRRLEQQSLQSMDIAMQMRNLKVMLPPIVDLIVAVGTCLVLFVGGRMALSGTLTSGSLVLFIWYLGKMYKPMRDLSKMTDGYAKAISGYDRIKDVLAADNDVRDLPDACPAPVFRGEIEFDHVTFSYRPGCPVLKDLRLKVRPGQIAALVGPTGSGKTTIVSLVARLYDPERGTVRIDGVDVKLFEQRSLRSQIAFVLQETLLFRGSVRYNIAYGKPDATGADILRAAKLANADEFIERMPQGYDTIIGERGVTLSGGQRQRIAIARAIICDAPILILDEAATGLDAASEVLVFEALDRLMRGRTSIVIAHRLATVQSADVIFVLKGGEIVQRGTHDQLLSEGGLYANLYGLQADPRGPVRTNSGTR
jgi:ATP-binding cassette, subfamily B, bacterial